MASLIDGPSPLKGQTALITGGGSGIGLAAARSLVADGASVLLMGRTAEKLESGAAQLADVVAEGATVATFAGDVTDESSVADAVAAAQALGPLTMCVASAGDGTVGPMVGIERGGVAPRDRRVAHRRVLHAQACRAPRSRHSGGGAHRRRVVAGRPAHPPVHGPLQRGQGRRRHVGAHHCRRDGRSRRPRERREPGHRAHRPRRHDRRGERRREELPRQHADPAVRRGGGRRRRRSGSSSAPSRRGSPA